MCFFCNLYHFQIRCVQLIDPDVDPEVILQGNSKEDENDDDDDDAQVKSKQLIYHGIKLKLEQEL